MAITRLAPRRPRAHRAFRPTVDHAASILEPKVLTAPILSSPSGYIRATAEGSQPQASREVSLNPEFDASGTSTVPADPSGSMTQTSTANTLVDMATGPYGASGIVVSGVMTNSLEGTVGAGSYPVMNNAASTVASTDAYGNAAPLSWNVSDHASPTGTGYVTATFQMHFSSGYVQGAHITTFNAMLNFGSNQISVQLNVPGSGRSLTVYDNALGLDVTADAIGDSTVDLDTAVFGDFMGDATHGPTGYQGAFNVFYQTIVPISTPFTQNVSYQSSLTSFAYLQDGPDTNTVDIAPTFDWSYTLEYS